jgi:hypothetical protein
VSRHIVKRQSAFAFRRGAPAERNQPRQSSIRFPIRRPQEHWRRVDRRDECADEQFQSGFFRRDMSAHHAGETIAIGDRERLISEGGGLSGEFFAVRRAFEE